MTSTDKIMGLLVFYTVYDCNSHQSFDKILSGRGNGTPLRNVIAHETPAVPRPRRLSPET